MKSLLVSIFIILSATAYADGYFKSMERVVTVSIAPQEYIVDRIISFEGSTAANPIKVNVMVPAGSDPHSFAPKGAQIMSLSNSSLYLGIGFPFEDSLIPQIASSMPHVKIVKTQEGIEPEKHSEGGHVEIDPHVWTSPKAMLIVVENTYNALLAAFPSYKNVYDRNYEDLKAEIEEMDRRFTALFASDVNKTFLVYHPTYGYLARDYGLTQLEVEHDGKEPKATELKGIINAAKAANVKLFIISPQQSSAAAQVVAKELGIKLTTIDNLAGDWVDTMNKLYAAFANE